MNFIELFFDILFPDWRLNNTPWKRLWSDKKYLEFITYSRFAYFVLATGYVAHYYFVDRPIGLTQDEIWYKYRFGLASASGLGLLLSCSPLKDRQNLNKVYFISLGLTVCYLQALSTNWYSGVPYFWGILFAVLFSIFSSFSIVMATVYCIFALGLQWYSLVLSGQNESLMLGAFSVAILVVMLFKNNLRSEIRAFVNDQERLDLQSKVIHAQKSMNDEIQAFLPRKIRDRLTSQMATNKINILQAVDEVLRQRNVKIAALFSDIRGYTQGSKKEDYLADSAIPNMKVVTEICENYGGIPRQVGDLVFSYFDDDNFLNNIKNSFSAAAEIVDMNERHNFSVPPSLKVRRFVLLDCGSAIVGNIGGVNSAREVTAMGSCINRLSRIDPLTKCESLSEILGDSAILMSEEYGDIVEKIFPALTFKKINLKKLNLVVKDFPETNNLMCFRLSEQSFDLSWYENSKSLRGAA